MSNNLVRLEADGISVAVDLTFGMIDMLRVTRDGHEIEMLHRAPWDLSPGELPDDAAPHLSRLKGDFFCAPFGDASIDDAPPHGWSANSSWSLLDVTRNDQATTARFTLNRKILGADLLKELTVRDGHPFLYQRHVFAGGSGVLPVANHAMVALPAGGRCAFSPKHWFQTPSEALEPDPARGRSALAYPASTTDPRAFPTADGGSADLTCYPPRDRSEDFVVALEAPDSELGWSAVHRDPDGAVFVSLRNANQLPVTMLWFSNGGRDYAPWNGRHTGVLGIEEGISGALLGGSAVSDNGCFEDTDIPVTLTLDPNGQAEVRHIIGCIPFDPAATITSIEATKGGVILNADAANAKLANAKVANATALPCDIGFLQLGQ